MAKYSFKIPHNRGITQVNVQNLNVQQVNIQQNNIVGDLNDMFLHLLFGRIALSNNEVYELETKYENNTLELNVSEEVLNKIVSTKIGSNLKTFMNWIANVEVQSLSDESDSSRSTGSSYSSESLSSSDSSESSESEDSDSSTSSSITSGSSISNSSQSSISSNVDISISTNSSFTSSVSTLSSESLISVSTSSSESTQTSSTSSSSSSSESSVVYPALFPAPIIATTDTTLAYTRYARILCKTGVSTLTFWSSPSEGDEIFVVNENGSTLTIDPNGSTSKLTLLYNDESARFVFMDGRWIV
jgi:hypothetical protein